MKVCGVSVDIDMNLVDKLITPKTPFTTYFQGHASGWWTPVYKFKKLHFWAIATI